MRKTVSIILAMLLLVSNLGLAFNVHFCGGEIAQVALGFKKNISCAPIPEDNFTSCCAEEAKANKCCSSHKVPIKKASNEELLVKSFQLDLGVFTLTDTWKAPFYFLKKATLLVTAIPSFYCESNAPPFYKLYCQYIFYEWL